jgi:hypothetical protein
MQGHATDDFIDTRTPESLPVKPTSSLQSSSALQASPLQPSSLQPSSLQPSSLQPSSLQPCPRSVRAWRAWLGALANDAEAAQAAALAYEQLDASGRDAWIDSLAQDALELGVPRIAVYAPLLAVEVDGKRRQRIQSALGPHESGAAPRQATRAFVGQGRGDLRVAVLVAPLYMDFVQVMACGYRVAESFDWVRHDPIVSMGSVPRAGERVEGVVVEASPLKGVIDELALTIVAHQRSHGHLPPALRAFAHVFGPGFGG